MLKISDLKDGEIYCCLKWSPLGNLLAAGTSTGLLEVFDTENTTKLFEGNAHFERISSMSWLNNNIFATGSRDKSIKIHDIREQRELSTLLKHEQEVCGLEWSQNGTYLASGGNDNKIFIWDQRKYLLRLIKEIKPPYYHLQNIRLRLEPCAGRLINMDYCYLEEEITINLLSSGT